LIVQMARKLVLIATASVALACGGDSTSPASGPPAHLAAVTDLNRNAVVGATIPGGLVVTVTDASGRAVAGASVAFAVTGGNGSTNPRIATTGSNGQATAAWTLGTIAGDNVITASVSGAGGSVTFHAMGTPGPTATLSLSPQSVRMPVNVDSARISAASLDMFGNATTPAPVLVARDPTLISVDASGLVRALRRGSATWVVATSGAKSDSVLVTVLAVGQSICTGAAPPVDIPIGQVVTGVSGGGFCVHGSSPGAEYAIIPYYNSGVASASTILEVRGQGISPLSLPSPEEFSAAHARAVERPQEPPITIDHTFENHLRERARAEAARRLGGRGGWRASLDAARASATSVIPAVGDFISLNANANDFCDNAQPRIARVAAVTNKAIVVADTSNPAGGFSDADYQSIGVTFDTLVDPVDRAAFGTPSDIDGNGHVILFFTRAVNELTPAGALGVTLGFFFPRDLYPKTTAPGPCAGSNFAEMFYLLVPDTGGVVNQNKRSKSLVLTLTNGTVAHEYQHLINASRRMYVNGVGPAFEEPWLDEGLAHIAEELNFFRSANRSPRTNLDATGFNDPIFTNAYSVFAINNFRRYSLYLGTTETQSPIGFNLADDDLQTRGAIWSFLRYAADHLPAGAENTFWFNLVNSHTSGMANLTTALGTSPAPLLHDWATSVFLDDNAPNVDPRYQQPSWNIRSILTGGGVSTAFPLLTHILSDNVPVSLNVVGYGVSFLRFSVAGGQDALLTVTSNGQPLPPTMQLSVVRVR
jgi:hypothetical protein